MVVDVAHLTQRRTSNRSPSRRQSSICRPADRQQGTADSPQHYGYEASVDDITLQDALYTIAAEVGMAAIDIPAA